MNKFCWLLSGLLLSSLGLFFPGQLLSQSAFPANEGEPYNHNCNFTHLKLQVRFNEKQGKVIGKVVHYFTPLQATTDSIYLHGINMNYGEVKLNGKDVNFHADKQGITIYPNQPLIWNSQDSISISYDCQPRKGIYFIGWNDGTNRCRKQIWTQGEGEDNRNWIPMFDGLNDKMTTEMLVTMDRQYKVLSNGTQLPTKENKDGTLTWHYKMLHRHSTYLIMLGIGDYGIEKRITKSGVPVNLYYYPDQKDRVASTYKYATESIDFLEEKTGIPFPWESYSQIPVQDFMYGAMENTTATIFGDFLLNDARGSIDRSYVGVDVHELTHQWFGDYITGRSWKHIWLQESFATFYPKLFNKKYVGDDEYQWARRNEHNSALGAGEKNNLPIVALNAGSERVYSKGSAVLDMMNYVWGGESFDRVINYYLRHHSYSNVETNDLYQAFQDTLGIAPDWFFNQWLYKGGEPVYSASYENLNIGNNTVTRFTVKQTQKLSDEVGLFKMPIVFEVHYTDGSFDSKKAWISDVMQVVDVPNKESKSIAFTLFDPGSYILKKVNFDKSKEELKSQLSDASNMIDRYDAAVGLRKVAIEQKRNELINQYFAEKYPALKAEIVAQLADDTSSATTNLIKKALDDKRSQVRLSLINNVKSISPDMLGYYEPLLKDSSYAVVESALTKLCALFPTNTLRYLDSTKNETGVGNSIRCKWLELKAQTSGNRNLAVVELVDLTSASFEFQTRKNAAEALKRLNYCDEALVANLFDAMLSSNTRLAGPMNAIASYFYENDSYKPYFRKVYQSRIWLDWQKEILDKVVK